MKSKGGRPLKFKTPGELEKKIEGYFLLCDNSKKIPTITGLVFHLNTTRKTLLEYENCDQNSLLKGVSDDVKAEYACVIKRAKARIEAGYEQALFNKNSAAGTIFSLKNNFGWRDKQQVKKSSKTIDISTEGQCSSYNKID